MSADILKLEGIDKIYPNGVVANKGIDFSVKKGEIHALMGENGAGKSTLMKIIFGMIKPDAGNIFLRNEKISFESSKDAIDAGIGMVHQHFMLVPSLSVAENMILGIEPKGKLGLIDKEKTIDLVADVSEKYNLSVDPNAIISELPVGMKQRVEILKALMRGAEILILDEPTAVLTPQETEELFVQLKQLRDDGYTIIFISHKLKEIKDICDRITIMRSGKSLGAHSVSSLSETDISRLMIGRDIVKTLEKKPRSQEEVVLEIKDLNYTNEIGKPILKSINLKVKKNQILGIAGVEGNGQRELIDIIVGFKKKSSGTMHLNNEDISLLNINEKRRMGMAHIPEDRMKFGSAVEGAVSENLMALEIMNNQLSKHGFLKTKVMKDVSKKMIQKYKIKCKNYRQQVSGLSGGNIQKVVAAREIQTNPNLIIADQPTRGIDVGAAAFIHEELIQLRDQGSAILLPSADLNEVLELADSLAVMYDGEIVAYFEDCSKLSEEELGLHMLGLKRKDE